MRAPSISNVPSRDGQPIISENSKRRAKRALDKLAHYDWNQFIVGVCCGIIAAAAWVTNMSPADPVSLRSAHAVEPNIIVVPLVHEVR